jgi:PAS domain-containing protein
MSGHSILYPFPVVALTQKENEHRGIAAVRAGALGYVCVDDITVEGQDAIFDYAVERGRLQQRLSDTDVTVLSMLRNINDGVIVVDAMGHIMDINPAGRTILGLRPRVQPDPTWEQTFCCMASSSAALSLSATSPTSRTALPSLSDGRNTTN